MTDNFKGTLSYIVRAAVMFMAGVALAILLRAAFGEKPDELDEDQLQYCKMVALFRENPEFGWPDFHGTYDSECATNE